MPYSGPFIDVRIPTTYMGLPPTPWKHPPWPSALHSLLPWFPGLLASTPWLIIVTWHFPFFLVATLGELFALQIQATWHRKRQNKATVGGLAELSSCPVTTSIEKNAFTYSLIHLFLHLFNIHLLNTHYPSDTLLHPEDTAIEKTGLAVIMVFIFQQALK